MSQKTRPRDSNDAAAAVPDVRRESSESRARRAANANLRAIPAPPESPEAADGLTDPQLYVPRELSMLSFHRRVLEQAREPRVPLLERVRFLSISSSLLDEFYEIRVSGLQQQVAYGVSARGADCLPPGEVLDRIATAAHELVELQYRVLNDELLPLLHAEGIRLVDRRDWSPAIQKWAKSHFRREILPVLTPIGLDPAHPFPRILNKSLNFIVTLSGRDAFGRKGALAIVQAPRVLPRLIPVTSSAVPAGEIHLVFLSELIHAFVEELFPGMKVTGSHQFRVTRNSDLWVDEEDVEDLLRALQGELPQRNFGDAVRLEVDAGCPEELRELLLRQFGLSGKDLFSVEGPVNLHRLAAIPELVDRPEHRWPPFTPALPAGWSAGDPFAAISRGDVLLHHPFQSIAPVLDFLRAAANDPAVLAIKQTLYRTGPDSPFAGLLIEAARRGKEVTAIIELRARFDEAANIELATRLQEAGAKVVYGVVGYKTHAKLLLVVRREGRALRRYVHLGTGNYHVGTARAYTDFGLLTAREDLGEDAQNLFQQLTGLGRVQKLGKLLQSPFTYHRTFVELVEAEAAAAAAGRPARIVAKMNALTEPSLIRALYRASRAGVEIDLVVRGVCALRPGVPGVSERIRVRSIVGRFLEHSRVFLFHADGRELVYCSSADWMERNFFRRVETCFPIEDGALRARVLDEGLLSYLADDADAWLLAPNGEWSRATPGEPPAGSAQQSLLARLAEPPGRG